MWVSAESSDDDAQVRQNEGNDVWGGLFIHHH